MIDIHIPRQGQEEEIVSIMVDDTSYRHRAIMGDNELTLKFSLAEHLELPVGSWCEFQGEEYVLMQPEALKMNHSRSFEYTVTMQGADAKAKIWKFRNPVDGRLKFTLTAKPIEHLQMFVDNMNRRDSGWAVGECIEGAEKMISYDHAYCYEALGQMAEEFETEFEVDHKRVSLRKIEHGKDNPLPLSYGRGNGFKAGVGRSNYTDIPPIEVVYAQGGDRNIDRGEYGSAELHLPKGGEIAYDGSHFEDEDGFLADQAREYIVAADGYSLRRKDKEPQSGTEDSVDCSEVYPKRIGVVSEVVEVDKGKSFYDIIDNAIPQTLDYEDCVIAGETMTIIFQSGMLAGREFDAKYYHTPRAGGKSGRRFEIVPMEEDGLTMPSGVFVPQVGDTYAVFHVMLPKAYINAYDPDNGVTKKEGAEWDMMRECVKYLYENEEAKFSFTGTLDGIWAKKDWANIGGRIVLGGYVLFRDERFAPEGAMVRIVGVKDFINNPHSPEIELSNDTVQAGFTSQLNKLEGTEAVAEKLNKDTMSYTRRRFRDAKDTMDALNDLVREGVGNFTGGITPVAAQMMQLLVGDESLQFQFVDSKTAPQRVEVRPEYDSEVKRLHVGACLLQHMTLGIDSLSSGHRAQEYRFWEMAEFTGAVMDDPTKRYWLYAVVEKDGDTGEFRLEETAKEMEPSDDTGHWWLLVGLLNSEYSGSRDFTALYGYTEVLPGRVTTDRIVSQDGQSVIDLARNAMKLGSKLRYENGVLTLDFVVAEDAGIKNLTVDRVTSEDADGRGVRIEDAKMEVYDERKQIVNVFEGRNYDSIADIIGGTFARGTTRPTGSKAHQCNSTSATETYSGTEILGTYTCEGQSIIDASVHITLTPSISQCFQNDTASSHVKASVWLVNSATGAARMLSYGQSASCSKDPSGQSLTLGQIERTLDLSHTASEGTWTIELRWEITLFGWRAYGEVAWSEFSVNGHTDGYASRFFANGFCLGTADNSFVSAMNKNGGMSFETRQGDYGIRTDAQGLMMRCPHTNGEYRTSLGIHIIATGFITKDGSMTYKTWEPYGTMSCSKTTSTNVARVTFPSSWGLSATTTTSNNTTATNYIVLATAQDFGGASHVIVAQAQNLKATSFELRMDSTGGSGSKDSSVGFMMIKIN